MICITGFNLNFIFLRRRWIIDTEYCRLDVLNFITFRYYANVATDKKDLSMQLTVNLIWGIVVSVPPQQPIAKLEVNAAQKLVNAGNQRLKILTIAYCKNNSKENCKIQTVNKNIFPGQERNLESISGYDKIVVKYNNWITKDNGEFELAVH